MFNDLPLVGHRALTHPDRLPCEHACSRRVGIRASPTPVTGKRRPAVGPEDPSRRRRLFERTAGKDFLRAGPTVLRPEGIGGVRCTPVTGRRRRKCFASETAAHHVGRRLLAPDTTTVSRCPVDAEPSLPGVACPLSRVRLDRRDWVTRLGVSPPRTSRAQAFAGAGFRSPEAAKDHPPPRAVLSSPFLTVSRKPRRVTAGERRVLVGRTRPARSALGRREPD